MDVIEQCSNCVYKRKLKLLDDKNKYVYGGWCCVMFEATGDEKPSVYQVRLNDMCEMFCLDNEVKNDERFIYRVTE